jgi:hypothetical protein
MGRVVYRGKNWNSALVEDWDFIGVGKLMLLMQCYPKHCCGLSIGLKQKHFFRISNKIDYGVAQHQGDTFCLFLMNCLLCFNDMFLHTHESKVRVAGLIVHCPFRVGGKGYYEDKFATVTIISKI